ncbi:MAG TPA: hypothetical protein VKT28_17835 [Puia sp.]|nr:hypothetical protein [Puia sp.]
MFKKMLIVTIINLAITLLLFYLGSYLVYKLNVYYEARDPNGDFRSWLGFLVIILFLLNLLIAYLILIPFRIVRLSTVLIVLFEVIACRIILNIIY